MKKDKVVITGFSIESTLNTATVTLPANDFYRLTHELQSNQEVVEWLLKPKLVLSGDSYKFISVEHEELPEALRVATEAIAQQILDNEDVFHHCVEHGLSYYDWNKLALSSYGFDDECSVALKSVHKGWEAAWDQMKEQVKKEKEEGKKDETTF